MADAKRGKVYGAMAIGIDLESAGFQKSLAATTRAVKATMSEMKAQMSIVQATGTELDKLETKYNATNKVIEAQEKELAGLHAKHQTAIKDFGETSKQATDMATKINNVVAKNQAYHAQLKKVSEELAEYKSKTTEVSREMKLQATESDSLARSMRAQGNETGALKVEYDSLSSTIRSRNVLIDEEKRKLAELKSSKGADATETREQAIKVRELETANHEAINSQKKLGQTTDESSQQFELAGGKLSSFKSLLVGGFITAGIGAVVGVGKEVVDQIGIASQSITDFKLKLGSTDTEAKQLTTSARNLFKQGFGESLDNVNNSLTQTKQLFGDMGNDEVQEVTKSSLTLANTFDTDVNEVLRGGKNLMTNFGISSKVAYDLMAKGGQEGLDFSQEMFDNISEYSVQFKKAGYSSQDMFAIMAAGSKNGVMNMDKVNDTVKEFGVRIGDGSKGVDGGMSAMTSATRKLWEQFKQGEATSSQVFSAVTKDLGNMKNENDRNNAGVALMGTQWEDVGSKAITAMGKAKGSTFEAKGTIDVMNKTVSDSNPWQKMGRNAQTVFAGIGQNLAPLSKNIGNNLNDMFANIPSMGDKIKTIFGDGLEGKKIDILSNYFDIGTVAAIIDNIGKVKEKFTEFKTALKGGTGNVFGGFVDGFNTMKTVIMSAMPAIKSTITGAITTFKAVFNTLKPFIMPIITQIVDIFKGIFTTLKTFWAENGTMIITAITNVIKGIQTAIQFILPIIKPVLAVIFSIISGVISNIKGVIQGGLSVIMGVIKIFSGLFTGNFSKMWEGIKQVFAGAIKFVWNAVNLLLVGRVLKGIKLLATGAKALVSGMWAGIKGFFTSGVSTVWNIYKSMPTRILNGFKTLGTGAKNVVSNMWSGIKGFFSKGISSVWNGIKSLPSKVINLFKNMKDGVFGWVKKMIDNVKDMPHRMAEGIKSGASALKNKFKSMFVGVVNVISKPVNGILGGINWVLDKVGATELPTWKVPAYAKGTDSHAGGLAMINDGKGKHYKEAVQNPDGSTFIAQGRNVVMPLQKGAKVLNGNDTNMWMQSMNIPHYANGIGNWFSGAWDSTKNVASKAWAATKEFAGDIWDYAKNPMKIVKDVVNSTLKPILGTMSKAPLSIAKGAVNTTFGSMGKWIKGIFEENGGTSGNVTGGAKAWIPNIRKAAKRMNVDLTPFGMESILKRITKESNGSASIVNNWDSNAKAGMPSKGLLQYIQPTLNSWVPKGVKPDLGNGYTQLLAMFNDSNWLRDINMPKGWGPTGIKRYANGGFIKKHQIAEIGEEGEEVIIPLGLNRRERAIQLLHKTMDRLGVSRDSGNSTIKTDGNINSATTVVNDNSELVALLTQQNSLLTQLVNKDSNTYLDSKKLEPAITKQQQSKDTTRNFFKGVIS